MCVCGVALDVHKLSVVAATLPPSAGRPEIIRVENTSKALRRLIERLGGPAGLAVAYEAGPTGWAIKRLLDGLGVACDVVAPSLVPVRPGDRVKTDRRDAITLARLLRAGELAGIWVPDEAHEAIRDLVRARKRAKEDLREAKQTLQSFLLRHERRFAGRAGWSKAHWRWLGEQAFPFPHQQLVFEEYKQRIREIEARCARLDAALAEAIAGWKLHPLVDALQALRGIALVAAAALVAEIGDLRRFANPKQLMAWLGLVPAEHSSGRRIRRGEITKAGNGYARTMLVEAGWCYRLPAREERRYLERVAGLPEDIRRIGWKAQVRLCRRYRHLSAAGKPLPKVITAIARELAGFVWDIARRVQPAPQV